MAMGWPTKTLYTSTCCVLPFYFQNKMFSMVFKATSALFSCLILATQISQIFKLKFDFKTSKIQLQCNFVCLFCF